MQIDSSSFPDRPSDQELNDSDGTTETIVRSIEEGSKVYLSVNGEIITAHVITEADCPTVAKEEAI